MYNQQFNMFGLLEQFQKNPLALLSRKFNIPQNMNDPNAILQHLIDTKQVSQEQVNRAMQFRQMLGNNPR